MRKTRQRGYIPSKAIAKAQSELKSGLLLPVTLGTDEPVTEMESNVILGHQERAGRRETF